MRINRTTRTTRVIGALSVGLALTLSACGSGDSTSDQTSQSASVDHNDADVAFASDMLQHHAQALTMVDLTQGRPLDPAVQQLADDIRAAQAPEIETMTGWLGDWDETVPDTSGSMGSMGGMEMDSSMPGMMSADEMTSLDNASDAGFQTMWLEMMLAHHEGAVEMAKTEQADGQYQPAIDLAGSIVSSQSKEIATMKGLLG